MVEEKRDVELGSDPAATANRAWALLADLQKTHARLIASLADLARITGRPSADKVEYAAVRFRVSEASLARRIVCRAVCDHLEPLVSHFDQQSLSRLRTLDAELARLGSQHVNRWTTDRISLEWESYCRASTEMRRALLKQVELERTLLQPLLHKYGSGHRRDDFRLIPIEQFIAEEAAA
jgi:hypothetical protein